MSALFGILGIVFGILLAMYFGYAFSQILLGIYDRMSFRHPKDDEEKTAIDRARNKIAIFFAAVFLVIFALYLSPAFRKFISDILSTRKGE